MPAISISVPFPIFNDRDGNPLDNGYVYIGTPYLDPQINPVQVYFDEALTIPAYQPLRTINGYVSNAGTPAKLYVNGVNFSIKVLDKDANLVYTFANGTGINPDSSGVQYTPAGAGAVVTNVQAKLREFLSIIDFGADPTGVADSTAAIAAANAAACSGAIGFDGNTVVAEKAIYFPAGTYKVTNLTYAGAPWIGAGAAVTLIKCYASGGACVNAVGTNSARKILQISNMSFDGSNCTGTTALGLQLGYNQRSLAALQSVRIDKFPGPAMFFAQPTWMMSFYDVYCSFNANNPSSLGSAILFSNTLVESTILALDWFNLQLENNGYIGSSLGGGIHINSNAINTCKFYGGTWEGNYGNAEAYFGSAINLHIDGLYLEAEAASVVNGLVFTNSVYGSVSNSLIAGETGMTGTGIRVNNTSNVAIKQIYSNIKWVYDISAENGSLVSLDGYNAALKFYVAGSNSLINRTIINRVQLTDAPTIAVDASQANSFYVTLFDNRTMGAPTNASIGQRILFTIIQNSTTAACNLAWNAVYKVTWSNAGNTANKRSIIEFEYDGSNWVQCSPQVPYL